MFERFKNHLESLDDVFNSDIFMQHLKNDISLGLNLDDPDEIIDDEDISKAQSLYLFNMPNVSPNQLIAKYVVLEIKLIHEKEVYRKKLIRGFEGMYGSHKLPMNLLIDDEFSEDMAESHNFHKLGIGWPYAKDVAPGAITRYYNSTSPNIISVTKEGLTLAVRVYGGAHYTIEKGDIILLPKLSGLFGPIPDNFKNFVNQKIEEVKQKQEFVKAMQWNNRT